MEELTRQENDESIERLGASVRQQAAGRIRGVIRVDSREHPI